MDVAVISAVKDPDKCRKGETLALFGVDTWWTRSFTVENPTTGTLLFFIFSPFTKSFSDKAHGLGGQG